MKSVPSLTQVASTGLGAFGPGVGKGDQLDLQALPQKPGLQAGHIRRTSKAWHSQVQKISPSSAMGLESSRKKAHVRRQILQVFVTFLNR